MKFASVFALTLTATPSCAFSPQQMHQRRMDAVYPNTQKIQRYMRTDILLWANKIGIFFGSSTGATEGIADLIASNFGDDVADGPFEIDDIQGSVSEKFGEYDSLVVGTPTWNTGADTERSGTGWDELYYGEMKELNIAGKKVAVFGLGDQISYSENYADASGELHDVFESLGCKMIGYTSQDGYEHDASKAIREDKFCGLLCDEVNQDDLSEERVENWVAQLKSEGILDGGSSSESIQTIEAVTPSPVSVVSEDTSDAMSRLEAENARLRKMLEDSKLMDGVLKTEILEAGFTPHHNPKTRVTMWTSADGKDCYYTNDAPQSP
eukprot:CAMPEP_0194100460 /NCGR_PEP_ID=MMETSP0150-20130528/1291_1 /TAXON_ID=122233 /ORGANISM="Chaetoceros debilis, Strain MM31A-1" /LENGTH=323 /DNA_ID=CAMNT_0038786821 /DNA_START=74 /DNA_END=1045 /DNA_ORIENTATION=-